MKIKKIYDERIEIIWKRNGVIIMKKFYELNDIQKVIVINEMKDIMNEVEEDKARALKEENVNYFTLDSAIDIEELIYRLKDWKFEFNDNELINMEVE